MNHFSNFIKNIIYSIENLEQTKLDDIVKALFKCRVEKGRLFILGVGGSCANASHAVNDFRKIAGIQAFSPFDNISELTARINDEGWEQAIKNYLECSGLSKSDCVLFLSVGGGCLQNNVSVNLINACKHARQIGATVLSITGRKSGFLAKNSDISLVVSVLEKTMLTPVAESMQSAILHLIVSHPKIQIKDTKW